MCLYLICFAFNLLLIFVEPSGHVTDGKGSSTATWSHIVNKLFSSRNKVMMSFSSLVFVSH